MYSVHVCIVSACLCVYNYVCAALLAAAEASAAKKRTTTVLAQFSSGQCGATMAACIPGDECVRQHLHCLEQGKHDPVHHPLCLWVRVWVCSRALLTLLRSAVRYVSAKRTYSLWLRALTALNEE